MIETISNKIGLGTAAIGRPSYINIKDTTNSFLKKEELYQRGFQVLDQAYELGIRYFDTAPGYGLAEELLIEWVTKKADPTIVLATKWGYTYVANFQKNATTHEIKEHSLSKLEEQWSQSKSLLPYLNVYHIHSATLETGVLNNKKVLSRLSELKQKHDLQIGITSTGVNQVEVIKRAMEVVVDNSFLFDAYQATYNIFDQSIRELYDIFKNDTSKKLIIKEAMANGRIFANNNYPHYRLAYETLSKMSSKYTVGLDAIALRFCIDTMPTSYVLSGASNASHLKSNLQATQFQLSKEDKNKLLDLHVDPEFYWQERKNLAWN